MNAERMPHNSSTSLPRLLRAITRFVVGRPAAVITCAAAMAVLAVVLTVLLLEFHTSRLDLLNPNSAYNKLWLDYIDEFGATDDVLIVIESDAPDRVIPALEETARSVASEDRLFRNVLSHVDLSRVRAKGLHYLDLAELQGIDRFVAETQPIVSGHWAGLTVGNMAEAMNRRFALASRSPVDGSVEYAAAEVENWAISLQNALASRPRYVTPWQALGDTAIPADLTDTEHFLLADGRIGLVFLQLVDKGGGFAQGTNSIDTLRRLIEGVAERHPNVRVGLTGLPVMENDEMRSSQSAMVRASLLSLLGVAALFVAGFGGIRHPLLTVATLLLAMAWSFGYITLAVGHLNILSVSFAVILIGLGIDFGIHYVARYLQHRASGRPCSDSLFETSAGVGPGILTGAVTTAIAFFASGFTEFTGIAELGIIAGGGILLCCLGAIVVLPAMIELTDRNRTEGPFPGPLDVHGWMSPLFRRPGLLLGATIALSAALALGMGRLRYDHNLLNLQPEGLESVRLEHRLLEESDRSVWYALSLANSHDELLARKKAFEACESVDRVEEIASLIPSEAESKRPIIAQIRSRLADLPGRAPRIPVERPEVLDASLARLESAVAETNRGAQLAARLRWIRHALRQLPETECYRRLSRYQGQVADEMLSGLQSLLEVSNPEPPEFSDLPESLVARFVGSTGRHLMKVYSRTNIWDMDAMEHFVREVRMVDKHATGNPLQTYEASRQMKRSYEQAAWYALAAIFLVLFLDFRNLNHALLAMIPVGQGMLLLFGVLGWLGESLNPANMIVLPLILGIGVDDGVHVVHDYVRRKGPYRMSASTASAVLITSLTTMVGFGSLMIADHRGLQSLGRVLTLGVTCCLFTSLVVLPAALAWTSRKMPAEPADAGGNELPASPEPRIEDPPAVNPMERAA